MPSSPFTTVFVGTHDDGSFICPVWAKIRVTGGRVSQVSLLDGRNTLLESIEYEYACGNQGSGLRRQYVVLPKRVITVAFAGRGPAIALCGESLLASCEASLDGAVEAWAQVAQPTREHRKLTSRLASMRNSVSGNRSPIDGTQTERIE